MCRAINDIFEYLIKTRLNDKEKFPHLHACAIMPNRRVELNKQMIFLGINSPREVYPGGCYSEHAEMAAIKKLLSSTKISKGHGNRSSSRKIKIDFWINRTSKSGDMKYSKPCTNCIKHMANLEQNGYKIVNVYFPDKTGDVCKIKFTHLQDDDDKHVSHRFRNYIKI